MSDQDKTEGTPSLHDLVNYLVNKNRLNTEELMRALRFMAGQLWALQVRIEEWEKKHERTE